MAIKRIMRHLKGTEDYCLWYKKGCNFEFNSFTDVDWTGSVYDRKSTSVGAFFLGKRLISWTSKKHNYISQSTTEVGYVAATINCSNIVWFKKKN